MTESSGVDLDVPAERHEARRETVDRIGRDLGIANAGGGQIEPHAGDALGGQALQFRVRNIDGTTAMPRADVPSSAERVDQAGLSKP